MYDPKDLECPTNHENYSFVLVDEEGTHYECHDCGYEWTDPDNSLESDETE